jgi:RNA recognition motif-containing protein
MSTFICGICCLNTRVFFIFSQALVFTFAPFSVQGYALIEYEKFEEAQAAIKELDGAELYKQIMSVDWAFSSGPAKRRNTRKRYLLLFSPAILVWEKQGKVTTSFTSFCASCVSLLDSFPFLY